MPLIPIMLGRLFALGSFAVLAFGSASLHASGALAEAPQPPAQYDVAFFNTCSWGNVDWDEMSEEAQRTWEVLGWTQQSWDSDNASAPRSESKDWSELSKNERSAARRLGYDESNWSSDNCR